MSWGVASGNCIPVNRIPVANCIRSVKVMFLGVYLSKSFDILFCKNLSNPTSQLPSRWPYKPLKTLRNLQLCVKKENVLSFNFDPQMG